MPEDEASYIFRQIVHAVRQPGTRVPAAHALPALAAAACAVAHGVSWLLDCGSDSCGGEGPMARALCHRGLSCARSQCVPGEAAQSRFLIGPPQVGYCHRHRVVHRDLKLDNTLLSVSPMTSPD
jgi:serine/threonine protein kinase